jgi:hypothetical protein
MKNQILVGLIVAAALLTIFAALFVVSVFSSGLTGPKAAISIVALIAALAALCTTIAGYVRSKRRPPL